ncbi:MAG: tRNA pseudouridine(38-40) synthase TruA [Clostridium sp.]|nr:tRNA pseudouridine(38-40) synthase TruA [Clostridium sp.]
MTDAETGMRRWFMTLAYNGGPYHGWQIQPGDISVQQVIEEALSKVLRRPTPVVGAGRTDAGVNASTMVAHFDTAGPIDDPARFLRGVNALVRRDIAVRELREVRPDAHARFDATSRTYHYFAHTSKSPFLYDRSWQCAPTLDFGAMNRVAAELVGRHDFTSFAKLHSDARTNICTVTRALWEPVDGDIPGRWRFVITADRFLRNMVRAVVGTLVEVGRGKMSVEGFRAVMERMDRCAAGTSMPPQALFLADVTYPPEIYL